MQCLVFKVFGHIKGKCVFGPNGGMGSCRIYNNIVSTVQGNF